MFSKTKNFLREFKELYLNKRMLVIGALGYASGVPFTLIFITYSFRLAESGINLRDIGLYGLAGLPFTIKFIWAPLVDGFEIPILSKIGQRKSWIIISQAVIIFIICKFAYFDPKIELMKIVWYAIFLAFASATYDTAYDAIRVEMLELNKQGAGAGSSIMGYRIGMLVAGGISLIIADAYSWKVSFFFIAATMLVPFLVGFFAKEPSKHLMTHEEGSINFSAWLKKFVVEPFHQFITANNKWILIILFAVCYKLGDSLLSKMINPFYLQMQFTKTEVAEISKFYGFIMTIIGGIIGGWTVYRIGIKKSLFIFGILQMLSNLTFVWLAHMGHDKLALTLVITAENMASAMGTAAFTAYFSSLCDVRYTATQYALLTSFMSLGRWITNAPAGYLVDKVNGLGLSWESYFLICTALAIPGLILIQFLKISDFRKN